MRAVKLSFSAEMLLGNGGIDKKIFMQILDLMPPDAKVVGLRESHSSMSSDMFIASGHFKMMADKYGQVPSVSAILYTTTDGDGNYDTYVSGIEFYDTVETPWANQIPYVKLKEEVMLGNITVTPPVTVTEVKINQPDDYEVIQKLWGLRN